MFDPNHQKRWTDLIRIGFGLIVVFGMVGNCMGKREGAVTVFIMTAVVWVLTRILVEALHALQAFHKKEGPGT